ncbi:unnamed protein product [Rhizoctonia solani]|uniref:Uncharacterized protein n=1 Tax=Rhizoctonia solani TaxID=456999 RepID=A0A8H3CYW7_9AGAM|nr:unnamed protein product [Rhizoctonia solani]
MRYIAFATTYSGLETPCQSERPLTPQGQTYIKVFTNLSNMDFVNVSAQDRDIITDQTNKKAGTEETANPVWGRDWISRARDIIADQAGIEGTANPVWGRDWISRARDIIADQVDTKFSKVDGAEPVAVRV